MALLPQPARARLLLAQIGDTPDRLVEGLLPGFYAVESAWDAEPAVQDAAVTIRACDALNAWYTTTYMSRVLTADERATLELRLKRLDTLRAAAVLVQTRSGAGTAAVYTFNLDFLEPAEVA